MKHFCISKALLVCASLAVLASCSIYRPRNTEPLTENVLESAEWARFLQVLQQRKPPMPSRVELEAACKRSFDLAPNVTPIEARYLGCIDAATKLVDPRGAYQHYPRDQVQQESANPKKVEVALLSPTTLLIRIPNFGWSTFRQLLDKLEAIPQPASIRFLLLDLRANEGGLITTVQEVAWLVVPEATFIGSIRGENATELRPSKPKVIVGNAIDQIRQVLLRAQVAVLVDSGTQSGAELFAQNLRHARKAQVFGQSSAGLARVQSVSRLTRDEYFLRLHEGQMFDAIGQSWEATGIAVDFALPATASPVEAAESLPDAWVREVQTRMERGVAR
jgi:hypothetical protein